MTGKAHLARGTVANQELLRNFVDPLHMRIMATGAFDVSFYQFDSASRVGCLSLLNERGCKVWRVFDRQYQAERVR
jgi:hypothetical protein